MKFDLKIAINGEFMPVTGLFGPVVDTGDNSSFESATGKQDRGSLSFSYMTDASCPSLRFLKEHAKPRELNWQLSYALCGDWHTITGTGLELVRNAKTGLHTLTLKLPESGLL